MKPKQIEIYDTTLRDGSQGEGINFSLSDKLRIAERLDQFGVHYIEGGWPGSNPKDLEFFKQAARRKWKNARIASFGFTRRKKKGQFLILASEATKATPPVWPAS
jgi:2-isopropylmalate synthase